MNFHKELKKLLGFPFLVDYTDFHQKLILYLKHRYGFLHIQTVSLSALEGRGVSQTCREKLSEFRWMFLDANHQKVKLKKALQSPEIVSFILVPVREMTTMAHVLEISLSPECSLWKNSKKVMIPLIDFLVEYIGKHREMYTLIQRFQQTTASEIANPSQPPLTPIPGFSTPKVPNIIDNHKQSVDHPFDLVQTLESIEKEIITNALIFFKGNRAQAARQLGLTERMMGYKVEKYDIDWKKIKQPDISLPIQEN